MADLNLPEDLIAFLRSCKQLEYDPTKCEAGAVTLLPLGQLKVELFPMDCQGSNLEEEDPHRGELGCYLVDGVNLVAGCTGGYNPVGLLLWLTREGRYGTWSDGDYPCIGVFGPLINWSRIAEAPAQHINAQWAFVEDSAPASSLVPWPRYPYSAEQVYQPLPDLAEWYEANWTRRGRFPKEIRVRLERDGNRCEITGQVMEMDEAKSWPPASTTSQSLKPAEWDQVRGWLEAGFWSQPKMVTAAKGETATIWSFQGYRDGNYHTIFRSYPDDGSERDIVHELGKSLAKLGKVQLFEADK
jgi:hypothetical protein